MDVRRVVRDIFPPKLVRLINRAVGASQRYSGPYSTWADAARECTGYDCPNILARVRKSTAAVISGSAAYEQDGVAFSSLGPPGPEFVPLLLAACIDGRLSVLDLGGALGTHYLRWKCIVSGIVEAKWQVIEQAHFVECGRELHSSDDSIHFHSRVEDASGFNAVLASSALQFFPDPMTLLGALVEAGPRVLVLDRTPFGCDGDAAVFVQHVPRRIYRASYPLQVFSWPTVSSLLSHRYRLLTKYRTSDEPVTKGAGADYWGAAWLRRD
jgi:putative methyltransferase (TIGR04325 family)